MTTVSSSTSSTSTTSTSSTDYLSFDTEALVEAKLASRYARIDSLEAEASANETKIAAYQDMQDLLQTLTTSLDALRANPSSAGKTTDVFRDRAAYLTSSTSASADTYMSATVEEGTDIGTHTVEITQIAKANIVASAAQDSKYDDLDVEGVITLGTKRGTTAGGTAQITITRTMSLADMADAINAETTTTGVKASVMQVSDGSYLLVLTTSETGQTIIMSDTSGTALSSTLGMGTAAADGTITVDADNVLQAAQDAVFKVDGVQITRATNDVDDVLDGVTLHLYAAPTTATTLTLEIDNDLTGVKKAINSFVEAYNAFRDFVLTNQSTASDGTASDGATLFGDATLRDTAQQVQGILSSGVDEASLALLGITFDENNKLTVDDSALSNALLNDFDAIRTLFSYSMTASSGDLGLVRHPDSSLDFTLDLTVSGDTLTAAVGGNTALFDVSGSAGSGWTLTGKAGTEYEGLTLVYTGRTSKAITVELSQGIADQLYNRVDKVANESGGTLYDLIGSLKSANSDLDDRISALESSTSSYKSSLTTMYANIASRLATAQTTLDLLKALLNADSN
ncbi:MAG: flagellar filament capping protein FliD [Magnetospirillum sp.]|nr:flagellar filament capping protein FliD [Magnetospirillum sp.]